MWCSMPDRFLICSLVENNAKLKCDASNQAADRYSYFASTVCL